MLNFLKQSRKLINVLQQPVCIVIGNESCDLDSAVCAISLAYFYQNQRGEACKLTKAEHFLPVLNINRRDYPLKTEVTHMLCKYGITAADLTFRDELHLEFVKCNDCILVDHHVSDINAERFVAIYDHRIKDESVWFDSNCKANIEIVGSCATLIGQLFLEAIENNEENVEKYHLALSLLRGAIVLDTVNFSKAAARATAKDEAICMSIEKKITKEKLSRDELFQELCKARADVSALTSSELLRKDLKIITNKTLKVALPGFPLRVQDFIQKPDAKHAIEQFAKEQQCALVLLLGMYVQENDGLVQRDIGLINIDANDTLNNVVRRQLLESKEPNLSLDYYENCDFMSGHFYKQNNVKATRKHILPIVQQAMDAYLNK